MFLQTQTKRVRHCCKDVQQTHANEALGPLHVQSCSLTDSAMWATMTAVVSSSQVSRYFNMAELDQSPISIMDFAVEDFALARSLV